MRECPFCGTKIKDESQGCPSCGYGRPNDSTSTNDEILGEAREVDSRTIPEPPPHTTYSSGPSYDGENRQLGILWKVILVLGTLFFSLFFGVIGGVYLYTRPYPDYKKFGRNLMILCVVLVILQFISIFLFAGFGFFHHLID